MALWFGLGGRLGRIGFYLLFAVTVTASVQLIGVFLVFASLIIPSVATRRRSDRRGLVTAYLLGLAGYALGEEVPAPPAIPQVPFFPDVSRAKTMR